MDKKDVYKEVFVILSNFNKEILDKIPSRIFNKIANLAADSEIEVNIDMTKELEDQNISEESKDMISLLYYKYIADDEEKLELIKIWSNNENK